MNDIIKNPQNKRPNSANSHAGIRQQQQLRRLRFKLTKNKKILIGSVFAVLVLALVGSVYYFRFSDVSVKRNSYQAIFLSDGQVYFGKLSNIKSDYLKMTDVYYLQSNSQTDATKESSEGRPQPQLIKLGSEIHGPEDMIKIRSQQVSYWENLKTDSKVSKAIEEFKEKQ